jgi:hypothetical protein
MYTLTQLRIDESRARWFTSKRAWKARTCWFTPGIGTKIGGLDLFRLETPWETFPAHTLAVDRGLDPPVSQVDLNVASSSRSVKKLQRPTRNPKGGDYAAIGGTDFARSWF